LPLAPITESTKQLVKSSLVEAGILN